MGQALTVGTKYAADVRRARTLVLWGANPAVTAPPCLRRMEWTEARPSPVPVGLVVKYGSKTRRRSASAMPHSADVSFGVNSRTRSRSASKPVVRASTRNARCT